MERCRADSIRNQLLSSADDEARPILDVRAADLQEEMAEQRFSVPSAPTKTAATRRTSQRAEASNETERDARAAQVKDARAAQVKTAMLTGWIRSRCSEPARATSRLSEISLIRTGVNYWHIATGCLAR
jgi:hypothetical protein